MRALKKTVVLLLLTVIAVVGGCDGGYNSGHEYHPVPTQSVSESDQRENQDKRYSGRRQDEAKPDQRDSLDKRLPGRSRD